MSEKAEKEQIIIKGLTRDGRKFRPSDWAQRLTTAVGSAGPGRRIRFHPKVSMATIDGVNCVIIDASLEDDDPLLFRFLINFGESNALQMERLGDRAGGRRVEK